MERQPYVLIAISEINIQPVGEVSALPHTNKNAQKLHQFNIPFVFATEKMSHEEQDRLYNLASGVLLPGGGDINPQRYGEIPKTALISVNDNLDAMQIRFAQKAIEHKKPILGFCRGAQVLAVASGAKLIQHLPDVTEEKHGVSIDVRDENYPSTHTHDIIVKSNTKAIEIFSSNLIKNVPTRHHQAIDHDNPGMLTISGYSPEGIVEIVEHPTLPFHIGIQTHPELINSMDSLFSAFSTAVWQYKNTAESIAA